MSQESSSVSWSDALKLSTNVLPDTSPREMWCVSSKYLSSNRTTASDIMCTTNTAISTENSKQTDLLRPVVFTGGSTTKGVLGGVGTAGLSASTHTKYQKLRFEESRQRRQEEFLLERNEFITRLLREKEMKTNLRHNAAIKIQSAFRRYRCLPVNPLQYLPQNSYSRPVKKLMLTSVLAISTDKPVLEKTGTHSNLHSSIAKANGPGWYGIPIQVTPFELQDELCSLASNIGLPPIPGLSLESRTKASRRKARIDAAAAFRLQRFFSMITARKAARNILNELKSKKLDAAARTITRTIRMIRSQRCHQTVECHREEEAATRIQCAVRFFQACNYVKMIRKTRFNEWRRRDAAIILLRSLRLHIRTKGGAYDSMAAVTLASIRATRRMVDLCLEAVVDSLVEESIVQELKPVVEIISTLREPALNIVTELIVDELWERFADLAIQPVAAKLLEAEIIEHACNIMSLYDEDALDSDQVRESKEREMMDIEDRLIHLLIDTEKLETKESLERAMDNTLENILLENVSYETEKIVQEIIAEQVFRKNIHKKSEELLESILQTAIDDLIEERRILEEKELVRQALETETLRLKVLEVEKSVIYDVSLDVVEDVITSALDVVVRHGLSAPGNLDEGSTALMGGESLFDGSHLSMEDDDISLLSNSKLAMKEEEKKQFSAKYWLHLATKSLVYCRFNDAIEAARKISAFGKLSISLKVLDLSNEAECQCDHMDHFTIGNSFELVQLLLGTYQRKDREDDTSFERLNVESLTTHQTLRAILLTSADMIIARSYIGMAMYNEANNLLQAIEKSRLALLGNQHWMLGEVYMYQAEVFRAICHLGEAESCCLRADHILGHELWSLGVVSAVVNGGAGVSGPSLSIINIELSATVTSKLMDEVIVHMKEGQINVNMDEDVEDEHRLMMDSLEQSSVEEDIVPVVISKSSPLSSPRLSGMKNSADDHVDSTEKAHQRLILKLYYRNLIQYTEILRHTGQYLKGFSILTAVSSILYQSSPHLENLPSSNIPTNVKKTNLLTVSKKTASVKPDHEVSKRLLFYSFPIMEDLIVAILRYCMYRCDPLWLQNVAHQLLNSRTQHYGYRHPKIASSFEYLANMYWKQGQVTTAQRYLQDCLRLRTEFYGNTTHPAVIVTQFLEIEMRMNSGESLEAFQQVKQCYHLLETIFPYHPVGTVSTVIDGAQGHGGVGGSRHLLMAKCLLLCSQIHMAMGDGCLATAAAEDSLSILSSVLLLANHEFIQRAKLYIGMSYVHRGLILQGHVILKDITERWKQTLSMLGCVASQTNTSLMMASTTSPMTSAINDDTPSSDEEKNKEKANELPSSPSSKLLTTGIPVGSLPIVHIDFQMTRIYLAICQAPTDQHSEARVTFKSTTKFLAARTGNTHLGIIIATSQLASLCKLRGNLEDAKTLIGVAYELLITAYGDNHPLTIDLLTEAAEILCIPGFFAEAEVMIQSAMEHSERIFGYNTWNYHTFPMILCYCKVLRAKGEFEAGEKLLSSVLSVCISKCGEKNSIYGQMLCELGQLVALQQKEYELSENYFLNSFKNFFVNYGMGNINYWIHFHEYLLFLFDLNVLSPCYHWLHSDLVPSVSRFLSPQHPWLLFLRAFLAIVQEIIRHPSYNITQEYKNDTVEVSHLDAFGMDTTQMDQIVNMPVAAVVMKSRATSPIVTVSPPKIAFGEALLLLNSRARRRLRHHGDIRAFLDIWKSSGFSPSAPCIKRIMAALHVDEDEMDSESGMADEDTIQLINSDFCQQSQQGSKQSVYESDERSTRSADYSHDSNYTSKYSHSSIASISSSTDVELLYNPLLSRITEGSDNNDYMTFPTGERSSVDHDDESISLTSTNEASSRIADNSTAMSSSYNSNVTYDKFTNHSSYDGLVYLGQKRISSSEIHDDDTKSQSDSDSRRPRGVDISVSSSYIMEDTDSTISGGLGSYLSFLSGSATAFEGDRGGRSVSSSLGSVGGGSYHSGIGDESPRSVISTSSATYTQASSYIGGSLSSLVRSSLDGYTFANTEEGSAIDSDDQSFASGEYQ